MYSVIIKFETLEDFLVEVKDYCAFCKEDDEELDYFKERKNLKNDILLFIGDCLDWNGENVDNYSVEIADCYLDEFLSKYEPEFWASIEEIKNKY